MNVTIDLPRFACSFRLTTLVALLTLNTTFPGTASADELSPPLNIIALEIVQAENVLRLLVRRRIEISVPPLDVNLAGCTALTKTINVNGKAGYPTHYFDLALTSPDRSASTQRHMISESFAAFVNSLPVQISVRDDACSHLGSRQVSGIRILD